MESGTVYRAGRDGAGGNGFVNAVLDIPSETRTALHQLFG